VLTDTNLSDASYTLSVPLCSRPAVTGAGICFVGDSASQLVRAIDSQTGAVTTADVFGTLPSSSSVQIDCIAGGFYGSFGQCVVGTAPWPAAVLLYTKDSSGAWSLTSSDFFGTNVVGYRATPRCYDVDGDGDIDCLVGSATNGVYLMRNTGSTDSSVTWSVETGYLAQAVTPTRASVTTCDLDHDSRPEILVAGEYGGVKGIEVLSIAGDSSRPTHSAAPRSRPSDCWGSTAPT